jgi:hypothetical protein
MNSWLLKEVAKMGLVGFRLPALFNVSFSAEIHTTLLQPKAQIAHKIEKKANP